MKKLLVIQIINSLSVGGAENIAKSIALNLPDNTKPDNTKNEFIIFENKISKSAKKELARKRIKVHRVLSSSFFSKQLAVYQLLSRRRPNLVHTHLGGLSYAFLSAKILGIPVIHTIHSPLEGKNSLRIRYFHWLAFRLGATPVAVSSEVGKIAKKTFGLKNLIVINNGIDINYFTPPLNKIEEREKNNLPIHKKILINIGNLKPVKNQRLIFKALSLLDHNDLFLLIVGNGELKNSLKEFGKKLGIDNFRIITNCNDAKRYLFASDIFILSSKSEGLPLSLLEAMAAKIPVISTKVGGMKKILIDHKNALTIRNDDAKALSSAISKLSANKVLRKKIARCARKLVEEKFTLSNMVKLYWALYLKKINENSSI